MNTELMPMHGFVLICDYSNDYFSTSTPTLAEGSGDEAMKLAAEIPDQDLKSSPSFAVPLIRL